VIETLAVPVSEPSLTVNEAVYRDHPDVQKNFVRRAEGAAGEHEQEAALILEGITCAACVWLNESHVRRQPGVTAIDINYTTRRARVRWDERVTKLSAILEAIAAIGYRAQHHIDHNAVSLAVVVQQLVFADAAGACGTRRRSARSACTPIAAIASTAISPSVSKPRKSTRITLTALVPPPPGTALRR